MRTTEKEKDMLQVRMVAMHCMSTSHTVDRVGEKSLIQPCLTCTYSTGNVFTLQSS